MINSTKVVFILIALKLFWAKQNSMINCIFNRKLIVLTRKNNQKAVQQAIITNNYTHIFIKLEITLFIKFKVNVFDNPCFSARFLLLTIDKIYLVEKWGKNFCLLYVEIDKIWKKIFINVSLLGVSAILTKSICL